MDSVTVGFDEIGKRYDRRVVLRGVSGSAGPGRVLLVTGPNGSGKSTLLHILCGLLRPTRGAVSHRAGEEEVERSEWRRHLGVVAPSMSVYGELSALENLRFFARVRGLEDPEAVCRDCLVEVGLEPDRETPAAGFSTGMLQRLKIAQAVLHRPAVVVLDEPGSNLDPAGHDWLEAWVRNAAAEGRTVILATNDSREMTWGDDRVALAG